MVLLAIESWRKMSFIEKHPIKVGKKMIDDCCSGIKNNNKYFEEVLPVYAYLCLNVKQNFEERFSDFSLSEMISFLGKKQRRNADAINDRIVKALKWLISNKYIECDLCVDIENIKPRDMVRFSLYNSCVSRYDGNTIDNSNFVIDGGYIVIFVDELLAIRNYCVSAKTNYQKTLLTFCCVRKKIPKRRFQNGYDSSENVKRYPEVFSTYYADLASEIKISELYISEAMRVLRYLNIFYVERLKTKKIEKDSGGSIYSVGLCLVCEYRTRDFTKGLILEGEPYYRKEIESKKDCI